VAYELVSDIHVCQKEAGNSKLAVANKNVRSIDSHQVTVLYYYD
jgi:hypothetical protein